MTPDLRIEILEDAKLSVVDGINHAITALKGSVEFSDAVEQLLVGTPFEKPKGNDIEGLYGRL